MKLNIQKYVRTSELPGKNENLSYKYGILPNSTVMNSNWDKLKLSIIHTYEWEYGNSSELTL